MVQVRNRHPHGKLRLRTALLLSSAIGIAAAGQAQAQATHEDNGPGDVSYTAPSVSGAPQAVQLYSPDGSITATIGTVTATATAGDRMPAVWAASDAGTVDVTIDSLTLSGAGDGRGLYTQSAGASTINITSVDVFGRAGVFADSASDVTMKLGAVRVTGHDLPDDDFDLDAVAAGRGLNLLPDNSLEQTPVGGNVSIEVDSVEVRGSGDAFAIHADAVGDIAVKSGAILSDGEGVDVSSGGDVTIALDGDVDVADGAVSAEGENISVTVAGGVTVTAGGGAVEAEGATTATIRNLGTIHATGANGESGQGAILADASGAITIDSNVATSAADAFGLDPAATIRAMGGDGAVSITAGTTTSSGGSAMGIYAGSNSGDISIQAADTRTTAEAITGGYYTADAIYAESVSGDVSITSGHAQSGGQSGSAIVGLSGYAGMTGSGSGYYYQNGLGGDVHIVSDTALANSPSGAGGAIIGYASHGNVTIASGSVTSTGGGISAIGGTGVDITSGTVQAVRTGIAVERAGGPVTITTTGDTISTNGSAIYAGGSANSRLTGAVTITTGAGTTTAAQGTALLPNGIAPAAIASYGTQDIAIVNNGTATSNGQGPAIVANSTGGKVSITSNVATNTGTGVAISAIGGNGVEVHATTVSTAASSGHGVFAQSTTAGDTIVDVGSFTGATGSNASAIYARADNGAVSVTAGSITNSNSSSGAWGINALGRGVTIVAGDVDVAGVAIRAATSLDPAIPLNDGHVSITTTGDITSRAANAISISGTVASLDVTIGADSVVTGNGGTAAVAGGARGEVSVTNNGKIVAQGTGETGIGVTSSGGGDVTVVSKNIVVDSDAAPVSGFNAGAITAVSQGGNGNVSVASETASISGPGRYGIAATTTGTGTLTINSGTLSKDADDRAGIFARSGSGDIAITSTSLANSGVGAKGIDAVSFNGGDIHITSGTLVNSAVGATGNVAEGIYADTLGKITVDAGTTEVHGEGASAIALLAGDAVAITSGTATTYGNNTTALYVGTWTGDVTVNSGTISLLGTADTSGIGVSTDDGAVFVTSESITGAGVNSYGISAYGTLGATVVSNDIATSRFGVFAQSTQGDVSVSLLGDTITGASYNVGTSYGVRGLGGDVTVITAAGTTTSAADYGIDVTARDSATIVNAGTVAANGPNAVGIRVTATSGIDLTSNIVTVGGAAVDPGIDPATGFRAARGGIVAEGGAGPIAIDSGSVTIAGDYRYGIFAHGTGAIDVTSDSLSYEAADSAGIMIVGGAGDVSVTSGTLTASGVSGAGVVARTGAGNITITADQTHLSGTGYAGAGYTADAVVGISQTGAVSITSNDASTAGWAGSAVAGLGASVAIHSTKASASGDKGAIVFGQASTGNVTIDSGTIASTGADTDALVGRALNGSVTITSGDIASTGALARGILAESKLGTSVTTGAISGEGYGVSAHASAGDTAVIVNGAVASTGDVGVIASGTNVGVTVANGGSVAGTSGISATGTTVTIANAGTVSGNGPDATGIRAAATGSIDIASKTVTVSGTAVDPGLDANTGFRAARGGIVAQGGAGAIAIDSGSVSVAGDYRYGIFAHGNGTIDIASDSLSYEAADSAGIMVVGGAGDVTVASGTLTGSGVSGSGVVVRTGAGDIAITADQTHLTGTGIAASGYTADAVVGLSVDGSVSVTSNSASSAGLYGSAVVAFASGTGNATVVSTTAATTGDGGVAVVARSQGGGDASVTSGTVTTASATSSAIEAIADMGSASVVSSSVTAADVGILAAGFEGASITTGKVTAVERAVEARSLGDATVLVNGAVKSANELGVKASGTDVALTVEAGGSVSGASGIAVTAGGAATITNLGTVSGTSGPAISAIGTTHLINAGTINAGTGSAAVVLDATDDLVTLRTGSVVHGTIDTGAGIDTVELVGTNAATLAQFANAERLDVVSGFWSTGTTGNAFDSVAIRGGAELQVNLSGDGDSGIDTTSVVNNGTLTLNYTNTAEAAEIGDAVAVSGTGNLRLIGAGELELTSDMIAHTGLTLVENGKLTLTGSLVSDLVTSGNGVFQLGEGGSFTGDLINDGTFVYARSDSYTVAGDFSGTGKLVKQGAGVLTFGGLYGFTGTTLINGGSVRFTGQLEDDTQIDLQSGTLDLSGVQGGEQTIGELAGGAQGTVALGSSQLTVNQSSNTVFSGSITGDGGLTKTGSGTLNLTGTSSYSGDTEVEGGTLKVNGALPNSTVLVQPGGTLGGNGLIGGLSMSGGTVAPGNSIGHLTVNGPVVFTAASVYAVEVNAAGAADRIDATGSATLGGAKLQVLAEPGRYRGRTSYTILTAAGGVSGTFGTVTSNFAFLTPSVSYGATAVTLNLTRNDASFASLGATPNEQAVGTALQALGGGNVLFEETLLLQDSHVAPSFASLSGELHAGVASGMIENAEAVRRTMLGAPAPATEGGYGWATLAGNWGTAKATASNLRLETEQQGVLGGVGVAGQGFNGTIGVGKLTSDFTSAGHARGDTTLVLGTIGYAGDRFSVTAGASHAWNTIDTSRTASLGTIGGALRDEYKGTTWQVFGEVAYGIATGAIEITPFAGLSHVESRTDAVSESGGPAALAIAEDTRKVTFSDIGLRLKGADAAAEGEGLRVAPYASAAWRHGWGDRGQPLSASFAGATGSFSVLGPVVAKDAAELGLGLGLRSGPVQVSLGYNGSIASRWSNHSAQLKLAIGF
ncbi:MAG: autotransporter-associated beta strand repeat-containing protein [Sphingomonas sp.]|uniref:autotransporter-associated beta strand repeat-containing protein n=1 Tax=Sphingomonas sp. TaxID=28214 RepID=UPI001B297635|nr:autotransporter-associated beta strand repeat-containing protein [Sphingomonas sp.]MBO9624299.1 autotransporter-associated beta strand repeat-containing protein [Sphingomonas sp.]